MCHLDLNIGTTNLFNWILTYLDIVQLLCYQSNASLEKKIPPLVVKLLAKGKKGFTIDLCTNQRHVQQVPLLLVSV